MNVKPEISEVEPVDIEHRNVYSALAAAQSHMTAALKSANNPHFKSKYADLASVKDACFPALNSHGIAVVQPTGEDETGRYVETIFYHGETDTSIKCRVPLIVSKNDMQGYGSAVTYARRYGLMSLAGIAPEDDDGNAAAKAPPREDEARKSSASLKRDGDWDRLCKELDQDLVDADTTIKITRLRNDYRERAKASGWPKTWMEALKDKFDGAEDEISKIEAEAEQHPLNA